jgi:hypothetical protein
MLSVSCSVLIAQTSEIEQIVSLKRQQQAIQLPTDFAMKVELKSDKNSSSLALIAKSDAGFLVVYGIRTPLPSEYSLLISNSRYEAGLSSKLVRKIDRLTELVTSKSKFALYGCVPKSEVKATDYDRLFEQIDGGSFGHRDFGASYQLWKASGAFTIEQSEGDDCKEVHFKDWPSAIGPVVYRVDTNGLIREIRGTHTSGIRYHLEFQEYCALAGVQIPCRVKCSTVDVEGIQNSTNVNCQIQSHGQIGFEEAQLHLPYYGIPEIGFDNLKSDQRIYPWVILVGCILGMGVLFWQNARNR